MCELLIVDRLTSPGLFVFLGAEGVYNSHYSDVDVGNI